MNPSRDRFLLPTLLLSALCSGCGALLNQVMWTRILSLVFGSTIEAVAAVTAIFMAGLAVGSALGPRLTRSREPGQAARTYARIEGALAVASISLAFILPALERLRAQSPVAVVWLLSIALLLIPTTLMGTTLVLQSHAIASPRNQAGSSRSAGLLFATNTLGATLGAYGSVLFLVPRVGVRDTILTAALLHVVAALGGLRATSILLRQTPAKASASPKSDSAAPDVGAGTPAVVLGALFLAGFCGLVNEVAWTRAFILIAGPTVHAFAFVLGAIVLGLAAGAGLSSLCLPFLKQPRTAFVLTQAAVACAGVWVIGTLAGMPLSYGENVRRLVDEPEMLIELQAKTSLFLLFIPAAFSGALFPLGLRLLASRYPLGDAMGRASAFNTAGAIVGASLAGFAMLPAIGLHSTLRLAAGVSALSSIIVAWNGGPSARRLLTGAVGLIALLFVVRTPAFDEELFAGGAYKYSVYDTNLGVEDVLRRGELVSYVEGRVANVSVKRVGSSFSLAVDGKVDATSGGDMMTQRLLGHVPFLMNERPARALVIGLGSGVTAAAAASHDPLGVTAIEISPDVVKAARDFFAEANHRVLENPKVKVVVGDARQVLLGSAERYDVVISEPSNPWMAGVSALFTTEFFQTIKARLNPRGVFCQWGHLYNMSERDLATLLATFADIFPGGRVFVISEADILIVGGEETPGLSARRLATIGDNARLDLAASKISPETLRVIPSVALADLPWLKDARRHTDDRPVLDFSAPLSIHAQTAAANRRLLLPNDAPTDIATIKARLILLRASVSSEWAYELSERAVVEGVADLEIAREYIKNALRLHKTAEAEAAFVGAINHTKSAPLLVGLALLYWNTNRPGPAMSTLAQASSLDPGNLDAYLLAAEIQSSAGALDAVRKLVARVQSIDPANAEAKGLLAEADFKEGHLEGAVALADQALLTDRSESRALEVRALALAQTGPAAEARAAFGRLLQATPEEANARINFGVFELQQGNAENAARLFKDAVDLDATSINGYRGLQEAASALHRPDLARLAERGLSRLNR